MGSSDVEWTAGGGEPRRRTPESVDASNGQLVEPGSAALRVHGVARVVERLDGYEAQAMHQTADERYGYETVAQAWTDLYEAVIASFTETAGEIRRPGLRRII